MAMQEQLDTAATSLAQGFDASRTIAVDTIVQRFAAAGDPGRGGAGARRWPGLADRPRHRPAAHRHDRRDGQARRRRQQRRHPGARQQRRDRRHGARGGGVQADTPSKPNAWPRSRKPRVPPRSGGRRQWNSIPRISAARSPASWRRWPAAADEMRRAAEAMSRSGALGADRGAGYRGHRGQVLAGPDGGRRGGGATDVQHRRNIAAVGVGGGGVAAGRATRRSRATPPCRACPRRPRASATWCT